MTPIDYLFILGAVLLVAGLCVWAWLQRRENPRVETRIVVWTREPLGAEDLARVFKEWPHDDERLQAVLQWMQHWVESATSEVVARAGKGKELNAAAGGVFWLECAHADLVERVTRRREK